MLELYRLGVFYSICAVLGSSSVPARDAVSYRPYQELTTPIAPCWPQQGTPVEQISGPGSGIQVGDVVLAINGVPTPNDQAFADASRQSKVSGSTTATFDILRKTASGEAERIQITVDADNQPIAIQLQGRCQVSQAGYGQAQQQRKEFEKATPGENNKDVDGARDRYEISVKPLKGVNEWDFYVESGDDKAVARILGRNKAKQGEYILRLWVEIVSRQQTDAVMRLKDVSLKHGNEIALPCAYAEPGEVAVVPSRDISLKVRTMQKATYILFFAVPRDVPELSLNLLDFPPIKIERPELPKPDAIGAEKKEGEE